MVNAVCIVDQVKGLLLLFLLAFAVQENKVRIMVLTPLLTICQLKTDVHELERKGKYSVNIKMIHFQTILEKMVSLSLTKTNCT
jgi:hypothetical protein